MCAMQSTKRRAGITPVQIPSHKRVVEAVGARRRATRVAKAAPAHLLSTADHSRAHRIMVESRDAFPAILCSFSRPAARVRQSALHNAYMLSCHSHIQHTFAQPPLYDSARLAADNAFRTSTSSSTDFCRNTSLHAPCCSTSHLRPTATIRQRSLVVERLLQIQ